MHHRYLRIGTLVLVRGKRDPIAVTEINFQHCSTANEVTVPLSEVELCAIEPWQVAQYFVTRNTLLAVGKFMLDNRPNQQSRQIENYLTNRPDFITGLCIETDGQYRSPENMPRFVQGILDELDELLRQEECYPI
jgi:hypothetical protein